MNKKFKNGAALLLTLLIITIAGGTVLVLGRDILATTTSTNRYADSLIAEQAAWAGIEDGLSKFKNHQFNDDNPWTEYFPVFSGFPEYKEVVRRNLTEQDPGGSSIAEKQQLAGDKNDDDVFEGIDYEDSQIASIADSCDNPNHCVSSDWDLSDVYYDLRVSGSDDEIWDNGWKTRAVNLKKSTSDVFGVIDKYKGFYHVTNKDQQIPEVGGVDKIFDLSHFKGKYVSNVSNSNADILKQYIIFKYRVINRNNSGNIRINFFVKYKEGVDITCPEIADLVNDSGDRIHGQVLLPDPTITSADPESIQRKKNFIDIPPGTKGQESGDYIWIPWPCPPAPGENSEVEGNVEYLGARFRFDDGATGDIAFGLRLSSEGGTYGDGVLEEGEAFDDSFLGTGVTKIISTGIYGSVRKTIEIWADKLIYADVLDLANKQPIKCLEPSKETASTKCKIQIYRDTK